MHRIVFLLLLIPITCFGQIGDIKKNSESHKLKLRRSNSNNGDECISCCCGIIASDIIPLIIELQSDQLRKKAEIDRIISFEAMPNFGVTQESNVALLPRLRANYGIFSTDLRMNAIIEKYDFYQSIDWNILQVNFVIQKAYNLSFGGGIMYEPYSGSIFNEYVLRNSIYLPNTKYNFTIEGRSSLDFNTGSIIRNEVGIEINYLLLKNNNFNADLMFGTTFQQYYQTTNILMMRFGLKFAWNFVQK